MQHTTWRKGIYMHWSCSCTQCIGYNVLSAAGNVRDSHHGSLSPIMLAEQAWQPKLGLHWIRWPGCEKDRSLSLYSNVDLDTWLSRSHDISRASCVSRSDNACAPLKCVESAEKSTPLKLGKQRKTKECPCKQNTMSRWAPCRSHVWSHTS